MHCFCNKELIKQLKRPWISDVFHMFPYQQAWIYPNKYSTVGYPLGNWVRGKKIKLDGEKEVKGEKKVLIDTKILILLKL